MKKSMKEISLERKIMKLLRNKPAEMAELIFKDKEIHELQDYTNIVSIKRLGFNDHGPVHMKKSALNAITMFNLLHEEGIKFNIEKENIGTVGDSEVAVLVASLLHDIGMTICRENHEIFGLSITLPIIDRLLDIIYNDDMKKRVIVRSVILEGIVGHMATQKIHSLEAGLVLIGDGCDMEKGRSRIPTLLSIEPRVGDIHRYSSSAIQKVIITKGEKKPIRINIEMSESVGFFQVEEVLFPKISYSPVKQYIELSAGVVGQKPLRYI